MVTNTLYPTQLQSCHPILIAYYLLSFLFAIVWLTPAMGYFFNLNLNPTNNAAKSICQNIKSLVGNEIIVYDNLLFRIGKYRRYYKMSELP